MALAKAKAKAKAKSLAKAAAKFSVSGWAPYMECGIELPNFFEDRRWQEIRIQPPPGPDETRDELDELLIKQNDLAERKFRKREIEQEDSDEDIEAFTRILELEGGGGAHPSTYVLMQAMIELGRYVSIHFKHRFMRPRPTQLEPRLRPLLDVPGHPSYPSGHAIQMFLIAKAMSAVVHNHELSVELFARAQRVAENREWAGLHYASDTAAGRQVADAIFPIVAQAYRGTMENAAREWL